MGEKLEKATVVDVLASLVLPCLGLVIGIVAVMKGEGTRGVQMIGLSIFASLVWSVIAAILQQ